MGIRSLMSVRGSVPSSNQDSTHWQWLNANKCVDFNSGRGDLLFHTRSTEIERHTMVNNLPICVCNIKQWFIGQLFSSSQPLHTSDFFNYLYLHSYRRWWFGYALYTQYIVVVAFCFIIIHKFSWLVLRQCNGISLNCEKNTLWTSAGCYKIHKVRSFHFEITFLPTVNSNHSCMYIK